MVATISKLHGGNATYYTKSYYLNGQAEGEWLDTEAGSFLGLAEEPVTPRAFERLLRGLHPERDEELVQNAGDPDRQLGWDVQFAPDKSVSVLYAMVPEIRAELESCLKEAVRSTVLEILEPEFLETRRGKGGRIRERVSSPVSLFLHRTNRENEIHLHAHAPIPNVGVRADGTTGTIVSWNLYDANMALGKAFHARFAELIAGRLGIECEFDEKGLSRVKDFPRPVAEALSTPSRRIAEAAEDGSARAKERANLKTRPAKAELPLEVVAEACRERAGSLGFSEDDARGFLGRVVHPVRDDEAAAARAMMRGVVASLPEEFSKATLFEHAFREGARAGISFAAVQEALKETLSDQAVLEPLGRIGGKEQYRKAHQVEQLVVDQEETHEAELREFLKEIIATTPELNVAEFLLEGSLQASAALSGLEEAIEANRQATAAVEELHAGVAAADIRKAFGELGLALDSNVLAIDAFVEAAQAQMEWDLAQEANPLATTSLDTTSLEGGRLTALMAKALSSLGEIIERARGAYAEWRSTSAAVQARDELARQETIRGPERVRPLASISPDADSSISANASGLGIGAGARTKEEAERIERPRIDGATTLPELEARSLLGQVIDRARHAYAERVADAAVAQALEDVMNREAHFTRLDLSRAVEKVLSGKKVPLTTSEAALDRLLNDPKRVVTLGTIKEETRYGTIEEEKHYSTPAMLQAEEEGFLAALTLQTRSGHAERAAEVRQKLQELPAVERNAVAKALSGSDFVLVTSEDGLQMQAVERGIATALRENLIERGIERALGRKDLLWVAPTATAARELQKNVGAEHVASLHKLLSNLDRGVGETLTHHGTMIVNAALKRPTWSAQQLELTRHTTVILDSASLADTRQFSSLLQHAERAGARVIACGTSQLPGLGPGGFFHELKRRSQEPHVVTLAEGTRSNIEQLGFRNKDEAKRALIERWAAEALKTPKDHTIVGVSGRDVRELNQWAQAERKRAGLLGFRWAEVRYRLDGELVKERIYEGDRVVFTARTDRDVINGVFGTVKRIDLLTGRIKVKLDLKEKTYLPWEFSRQKTIEFQYRDYRFFRRQEEGFRLGYAATVYRSQNVAVEGNSYCLLGGPSGAPSAVYSALGLAKGTTYFFGDQMEQRKEQLEPKVTAHEVRARAELERRAQELEQGGMKLGF